MQATRKQKANASWCIMTDCIDCIDCITSKHMQAAGCLVAAFDSTFDVAEPEPEKEAMTARTDGCAALVPAGVWFFFQNACGEQSLRMRKYYPFWGLQEKSMTFTYIYHVSTKWQYVTIVTSTTIVQFFVSTTPIGKPPGQLQSHHPEAADLGETFRWEEMEGQRLTEGPGVCHHNAAGWSSPETWDQQKWKVDFFLQTYTSLKNKMMHVTVLPNALDADMGKLPSRKSKIRSACCRRACDLSSQGKNPGFWLAQSSWRRKNAPVEKKIQTKKMSDIAMFPCSHGDLWVCIFVPIPEPRDIFWILQAFVLPEHLVASYSSIRTMFVWKCCVIVHKLYGSKGQLGLPWRLSLSFEIWRGKHLFASPMMLCSCLVLSSLRSCRSAPLFPSNTTPTTAAHRIVFAPQRSEKTPSSSLNWRQIKC